MMFVKVDDLKPGMRLGKPIYNRNGVLLHERNSRLTVQSIYGVRNFGLLGLYILEPAEPLPPMSAEDIALERFQTMAVFGIRDVYETIIKGKSPSNLENLISLILRNYGSLDHKINFVQSLRSPQDYLYKYALNTSCLAAMIAKQTGQSSDQQYRIVKAVLLHLVGAAMIPYGEIDVCADWDEETWKKIRKNMNEVLRDVLDMDRYVTRILTSFLDCQAGEHSVSSGRLNGADILMVANRFDRMTAMKSYEEPTSEVAALRYLLHNDETYRPEAVQGLIDSINILSPGVCVELTNKQKGLVIRDNPMDVLHPIVLSFQNNQIFDLSNARVQKEVDINDIMKTMDNRIRMDMSTLHEYQLELEATRMA